MKGVPTALDLLQDRLGRDNRNRDNRGENYTTSQTTNKSGVIDIPHRMAEMPTSLVLLNPAYGVRYCVTSENKAAWGKDSVQVTLETWHLWATGTATLPSGSATVVVELPRKRASDASITTVIATRQTATPERAMTQLGTTVSDGYTTHVTLGTASGGTTQSDVTLDFQILTGVSDSDEFEWQVS
jgi:hypothetical protein